MKEINLKVSGMVCGGCENRVKNALKNITGVKEVSASCETKVVTVTCQNEVEGSIIKETIENLGYEIIKG